LIDCCFQEIELLKHRLAAEEAAGADAKAHAGRQQAQIASLKDQITTLGDHATKLARAKTAVLAEMNDVRLQLESACDERDRAVQRAADAAAATEALEKELTQLQESNRGAALLSADMAALQVRRRVCCRRWLRRVARCRLRHRLLGDALDSSLPCWLRLC
jgi:hypothetical protein